MRGKTGRVVECLLLSTALLGCGDVQNKPGVPIEVAPAEIAKSVCPKAWTCCTAAQLMNNQDLAGTDERSCEIKTADGYGNMIDTVIDSERAGRARYDGAKLETCLANVRAATCDQLRTTHHLQGVPGCETFVEPLVAVGGDCQRDFECIGSLCRNEPNMSGPGVCTVPRQAGEACSDADRCGSDLACDGTTSVCVAVAPPANTCFYASGCSAGGAGRPSLLGALALAAAAAAARRRTRK